MTPRDEAIRYVRSLTASDSSPEHVRDVCRLAVIKFSPCTTRGEPLSADQLKAEVFPSALYGMGEVVRVDENGTERPWTPDEVRERIANVAREIADGGSWRDHMEAQNERIVRRGT